jgi:3-methyl-2-oxobutanoate hydroxymethyltransferase
LQILLLHHLKTFAVLGAETQQCRGTAPLLLGDVDADDVVRPAGKERLTRPPTMVFLLLTPLMAAGSQRPLLIADLPFLSYQCGADDAVAAAGRVLKETPAAAVKLEGAEPETLVVIDRMVRSGIPVMGHLGLTPQSVHRLGYRRQAQDPVAQERLQRQARELEAAGCFALVLEHVPASVATTISGLLTIPMIGIGAGEGCDGQVRVTADLLGLTPRQPPFSPPLIDGRGLAIEALRGWIGSQRTPTSQGTPAAPHC